ncbi:MAG: 2-hydroxychromene-2-carboxylate isomerase [Betaproteobacteria bacterium]|nr:2-hydroxychromene-2-carboxylate isomerase [Betaproteobacteria bacterium]MDH5577942.1 2-hydroxychromene-2-carboxylate isomerase [Betaproteobacteria bacterium]
MKIEIDFFYYIGSTYTYLSVNRVDEIAAREGVSLRWRPFNVRAIMMEQNNRPFIGKPVKLKYMWRDLERRAERYGIPFKSIPEYPVDPDGLANRVATVASLEGWCPEYTKATYRQWFLDNKTPGELEHVRSVLSTLGRDADAVIDRANAQEVRACYDRETERAKALGVFGSPTFMSGTEIFWGDDRFEDAIDWAKAHAR